MKCYWWRPGMPGSIHLVGKPIKNYGDQINEYVLQQLAVDYEWALPNQAELVVCGSVLEHLPANYSGTVCGAGKLLESSKLNLSDARVFALRGKLSLSGVSMPHKEKVVLGDPGLLLPLWVRQQTARYPVGVMPHYADKELWQRFSYGHYIDPTQSVHKITEEIGACRRLITSSLHGAVVADAYQIPRQLELPNLGPKDGGDFKFRDYASIYDTDPHFGKLFVAPRKTVERIQAELLAALTTAVGIDLAENDWRNPQVSLLVPFRDDGEHRSRVWRWLRARWRSMYPEAEIIMGQDDSTVFCKSAAVNDAYSRARGRTLVILDADAWLAPGVITKCANDIEQAGHKQRRLWFMPYSMMHRLTHEITLQLLDNQPAYPIPLPPPPLWTENVGGLTSQGHSFGALAQVMPREGFELVNGMDERFREGWGGEDGSFLRSMDTLWQQHEVAPGDVVHLWHATKGKDWRDRAWVGQTRPNANARLSNRYTQATSDVGAMRALCDEHPLGET